MVLLEWDKCTKSNKRSNDEEHNYKMQMLRFKEMQKDDATKGNTDWLVGWKKVMEGN